MQRPKNPNQPSQALYYTDLDLLRMAINHWTGKMNKIIDHIQAQDEHLDKQDMRLDRHDNAIEDIQGQLCEITGSLNWLVSEVRNLGYLDARNKELEYREDWYSKDGDSNSNS